MLERTGAFYQELIHNQGYQDKTILIDSHGCSSRALLYHVEHPGEDFWRGHVPANCAVSIVDVQDGKSKLEELDKIYYNPEDVIDFYD